MKNKLFLIAATCICFFSYSAIGNPVWVSQPASSPSKVEDIKSKFNSEGISFSANLGFVENKGQIGGVEDVKFAFKQGNTQVFLLGKGLAYQFTKIHEPEGYRELLEQSRKDLKNTEKLFELQKQGRIETFRMDMTLVNANTSASVSTTGKSTDYLNYTSQGIYEVHHFEQVTYHDVYPGIDWVIYNKDDKIKYDFIVKPGADPSLIKMQFSNQESLTLNKDGSFTLKNKLGNVTEKKPLSFQGENTIKTQFKLQGNTISFILENYDASQILSIDPAVVWATYYGGTGFDYGASCTTDASGNVYLTGRTLSTANIASGGHQNTHSGISGADAFLIKFSPTGARLWGTYYGDTGIDQGLSCATDAAGNVYLAGSTNSTLNIASGGHQNVHGGGNDAFLVKFNSSGILLWATYYGGAGVDAAHSCAVDAVGNVYLAGETQSSASIASGGHQNVYGGSGDAFLVKFNSSGTLLWGTYYGDTGIDYGYSCATDAAGDVYLAGQTRSILNIASGGHQNAHSGTSLDDAFLVKFSSTGVRLWATYYGDTGSDAARSCVIDASGNVYLAGQTQSFTNMAFSGHQSTYGGGVDAFLVKFSSTGVRLWATYYGGTGADIGHFCITDAWGNVYLAGETQSNANIASGGHQNTHGGGTRDAFLVKFNSAGTRLWATYYGGAGFDVAHTCATDASGNVFLAGETQSPANIASGGFQNVHGGGISDAFLVKFCDNNVQPSVISGNTLVCAGSLQNYSVAPVAGATGYTWMLPGGWPGTMAANSISVSPLASGILSVSTTNTCSAGPIQTLSVTVSPLPTVAVNSGSICEGNSFTIIPSGANTYTISGGSFTVTPLTTTHYSVTGTSTAGCVSHNTAVANINVHPLPVVTVNSGTVCEGTVFTMTPSGAQTYVFSNGTSTVAPISNTTYSVSGFSSEGCASSNTAIANVTVVALPVITVNSGAICTGESFTLVPGGALSYTFSNGLNVVNPLSNTSYSVSGTSSEGCVSAVVAISNVTVHPLPAVIVNSSSSVICSGESSVLTASGAGSYSWSTGASESAITVSPLQSTAYTVIGTDNNGCVNTYNFMQVVNQCIGIRQHKAEQVVKMYPNPNNGKFVVEVDSEVEMLVYNYLGAVVLKQLLETGKNYIDLGNEVKGVYVICIKQKTGDKVLKLIKS